MKDIVYVNGNLIFKSGYHQVKELVAYAGNKWREIADEIIDDDLVITQKDILVPYKIYCAAKEICTYGNFISGLTSPQDAINIYKQEIENLKKLQNQKVASDLINVLNRQIYIGIVSTMELFLCDFLYSMVLGTRKYYNKFCENASRTFKLKRITSKQWRVQDAVAETILETNYHRISEVKKLYEKVLGINIPKSKKLENFIITRHSLVHRNGFPSAKSEYIKVDNEMINELIEEVESLTSTIINTKKIEIENWFPKIE